MKQEKKANNATITSNLNFKRNKMITFKPRFNETKQIKMKQRLI